MINAKELRLGCNVEYNGLYFQVCSIVSPSPLKDKRFSDKWIVEVCNGCDSIHCTIDEINPILITEEMLLKCGFCFESPHEGNLDISEELRMFIDVYNNDPKCTISDTYSDFTLPHIKYLHQLQNVIWCLTNQELNVNL